MSSKASRIPSAKDRLRKQQIDIRNLQANNRNRNTPRPVATTASAGSSAAGDTGGGTGNFLSTKGDTMIGPLALAPPVDFSLDIDVNGAIDIGPANTSLQYSSNIQLEDIQPNTFVLDTIAGAAFDGQLLVIRTFAPSVPFTIAQATLDNGGNIVIPSDEDITLGDLQSIILIFDEALRVFDNTGGSWRVISTSGSGGGGGNASLLLTGLTADSTVVGTIPWDNNFFFGDTTKITATATPGVYKLSAGDTYSMEGLLQVEMDDTGGGSDLTFDWEQSSAEGGPFTIIPGLQSVTGAMEIGKATLTTQPHAIGLIVADTADVFVRLFSTLGSGTFVRTLFLSSIAQIETIGTGSGGGGGGGNAKTGFMLTSTGSTQVVPAGSAVTLDVFNITVIQDGVTVNTTTNVLTPLETGRYAFGLNLTLSADSNNTTADFVLVVNGTPLTNVNSVFLRGFGDNSGLYPTAPSDFSAGDTLEIRISHDKAGPVTFTFQECGFYLIKQEAGGGSGGITIAYNTIEDEGIAQTQRTTMNFIGSAVVAVDNPTESRTDITISAGGTSLPVSDITPIVFGSGDATKQMRFEIDNFTTGNLRVMTLPDASVTLAGLGVTSQTWTGTNNFAGNTTVIDSNFTIDESFDNTIQAKFDLSGATAGQVLTLKSNHTANRTLTFPNTTTSLAGLGTLSQTWTGENIFLGITDVRDANFTIQNVVDPTKQAQFEVSNITTGTTRTYTFQDASGTFRSAHQERYCSGRSNRL